MNEVYCRAGVCERPPAAFGGSPICKGLPCPTSFAGPGALKTTEEKAEVPSLDKEGWLRPLRKCREASLAGADGVVGSSHRLSEVERTTPFLMFRPTGLTLRAAPPVVSAPMSHVGRAIDHVHHIADILFVGDAIGGFRRKIHFSLEMPGKLFEQFDAGGWFEFIAADQCLESR